MEIPQLLQVSKDDASFPPKVLGEVDAIHLRKVVFTDVPQGSNIFSLCGDHFIDDMPKFTTVEDKEDYRSGIHLNSRLVLV